MTEKIQTHHLFSINIFKKSSPLYELSSEFLYFHCDKGYENAPRFYVIPAFSILLL